MAQSLETRLSGYDGVAVSLLSEARMACRDDPGFRARLLRLCTDDRPLMSEGATWILKAEIEEGLRLTPEESETILAQLDALSSWQARLHICQSVDGFSLHEDQAARLADWAAARSAHERPFPRAWALHVTVSLGTRFAGLRPAARAALDAAADDTAASVRARARKLEGKLQRAAR